MDTENLKPYLSYLLYNTPDSDDNLFYFPFITYDSSIELAKQITEQFTSLTKFGTVPKLSGYLKNNGDYYFQKRIIRESSSAYVNNPYVTPATAQTQDFLQMEYQAMPRLTHDLSRRIADEVLNIWEPR